MISSPQVSVVMSVYNGASRLRESVKSILSQEGVDLEFIIVNDGSTDGSGGILREYAERDNRVRIFEQENTGLTIALTRGCTEARGEYIARQDAGDISLPSRLKIQKDAFELHNEISFVSCITEFCGPDWEHLFLAEGNGLSFSPAYIISDQHKKGVIDGPTHHGSVMFRKKDYERAGGYRHQFYITQDWDLWYRLAEVGKFQIIPETLYRARLSPGSISALHKNRQDRAIGLAREALRLRRNGISDQLILAETALIRPVRSSLFTKKRDAAWLYFIGECLRRNGDSRAYFYLRRSIMENPLSLKPWIRMIQVFALLMTKQLTGRS